MGPRPSTPRQPEERSNGPERLVRARPNKGAAPDPLNTSVGYIGGESLAMERQRKKAGEKAFRAGLVGKPKPRRP